MARAERDYNSATGHRPLRCSLSIVLLLERLSLKTGVVRLISTGRTQYSGPDHVRPRIPIVLTLRYTPYFLLGEEAMEWCESRSGSACEAWKSSYLPVY
jgi:hypothetical protein